MINESPKGLHMDARGEVQSLLETLGDMNEAQKKDMLVFFQGVAFGRMLAERQAV